MLGRPLQANDKQAEIQAVDTRQQNVCHIHTHTPILFYTYWMAANTHSIVQPLGGNSKQTLCYVDRVNGVEKNGSKNSVGCSDFLIREQQPMLVA